MSGNGFTGDVCGNVLDGHYDGCLGGICETEDYLATIAPDGNTVSGDGWYVVTDGITTCSITYDFFMVRSSLAGGGGDGDIVSIFNYDAESEALVFARSIEVSPPMVQVLGTIPPGENVDFTLRSGSWYVYTTYPGDQAYRFESARAYSGSRGARLGAVNGY